jgi:hypothetical protein
MKTLRTFTPKAAYELIASGATPERRRALCMDARIAVLKQLALSFEKLAIQIDSVERVAVEAKRIIQEDGIGRVYSTMLSSSCIDDVRVLASEVDTLRHLVEGFTRADDDPEADEVDRFVHAHLSE